MWRPTGQGGVVGPPRGTRSLEFLGSGLAWRQKHASHHIHTPPPPPQHPSTTSSMHLISFISSCHPHVLPSISSQSCTHLHSRSLCQNAQLAPYTTSPCPRPDFGAPVRRQSHSLSLPQGFPARDAVALHGRRRGDRHRAREGPLQWHYRWHCRESPSPQLPRPTITSAFRTAQSFRLFRQSRTPTTNIPIPHD